MFLHLAPGGINSDKLNLTKYTWLVSTIKFNKVYLMNQ